MSRIRNHHDRIRNDKRRSDSNLGAAPLIILFVIFAIVIGSFLYIQQETREAAERINAEREQAFQEIAELSDGEQSTLRQYLNRDHVNRGRELGIDRIADRYAAQQVIGDTASPLREVQSNQHFLMSPYMRYGLPYVTNDKHNLITLIGERFQQELSKVGLPPYRFLITSVLRTTADQNDLRQVNRNAARGTSSHEFGTTADIHYQRFDHVAELDSLDAPTFMHRHLLERQLRERAEDFAQEYQEELKALLGRVLIELQDEGKALVIYERNQPVYHVTVGSRLSDERLAELTQGDSAKQVTPVSSG